THLEVADGPAVNGLATIQIHDKGTDEFESINFAGKTNVTINTGSAAQLLVINYSVAPPGLSTLTVNASPANDDIDVTAVAPGVTTTVNGLDGDDLISVIGAGIPSGTTLFLDDGAGSDRLAYDTGGVGIERSAGPNPGQTTIMR